MSLLISLLVFKTFSTIVFRWPRMKSLSLTSQFTCKSFPNSSKKRRPECKPITCYGEPPPPQWNTWRKMREKSLWNSRKNWREKRKKLRVGGPVLELPKAVWLMLWVLCMSDTTFKKTPKNRHWKWCMTSGRNLIKSYKMWVQSKIDQNVSFSHYSKSQIFVQKFNFMSFSPNFFWQFFSWNQSCQELKIPKPQHFHEFLTPNET